MEQSEKMKYFKHKPDKFWVDNLKRLARMHAAPRDGSQFLDPAVAQLAFILLCHLEDHHKLKGRPLSELEKFLEA